MQRVKIIVMILAFSFTGKCLSVININEEHVRDYGKWIFVEKMYYKALDLLRQEERNGAVITNEQAIITEVFSKKGGRALPDFTISIVWSENKELRTFSRFTSNAHRLLCECYRKICS